MLLQNPEKISGKKNKAIRCFITVRLIYMHFILMKLTYIAA